MTTNPTYLLRFTVSLTHGTVIAAHGLQRVTTMCVRPLGVMTNILVAGIWIINFVIQFERRVWDPLSQNGQLKID